MQAWSPAITTRPGRMTWDPLVLCKSITLPLLHSVRQALDYARMRHTCGSSDPSAHHSPADWSRTSHAPGWHCARPGVLQHLSVVGFAQWPRSRSVGWPSVAGTAAVDD